MTTASSNLYNLTFVPKETNLSPTEAVYVGYYTIVGRVDNIPLTKNAENAWPFTVYNSGATPLASSQVVFEGGARSTVPLSSTIPAPAASSSASTDLSLSTQKPATTASRNVTEIASSVLASSNTPSPTSGNPENCPVNHYSAGETAGIGIGAAIAGGILAFAAFLLFFRKKYNRGHFNPPRMKGGQSTYPETKPGPTFVNAAAFSPHEASLPQPVADSTITREMSSLRNMVKNHVQSFYKSSGGRINQTAVSNVVQKSQLPVQELTAAFDEPRSRHAALRHLIAAMIFERIESNSDATTTFLPPSVVSCLQSLEGMKREQRVEPLGTWRVMTAAIFQNKFGQAIQESDPRSENINKALKLLEPVLGPLAAPGTDKTRRNQNLGEILKRAANFGFLIFSQPSLFAFDWSTSRMREPGSIVVWPALIQVANSDGQTIPQARLFEDKEIWTVRGG